MITGVEMVGAYDFRNTLGEEMTMNRVLCALVTALVSCLGTVAAAQTYDPRSEVVCPAVRQDNRRRTNAPFETEQPIELIALVKRTSGPTPQEDPRRENNVVEVEILKTLYGRSDAAKIRIIEHFRVPTAPMLAALTAAPYGKQHDYEVKYWISPDEEWSQRALAAARLDFNVLSAATIFVGREIPKPDLPDDGSAEARLFERDERHLVEVDRTLFGTPLAAGQKVIVNVPLLMARSSSESLRGRAEPLIYFIGNVEKLPNDRRSIFHVGACLAAACEEEVKASLGRREWHPLVDVKHGDLTRSVREVTFAGTAADAIRLMDSSSEAAATLGARKLILDKARTLPVVVAEIERELFAEPDGSESRFRRQHNLIQLLKSLENAERRTTAGLLNSMLQRLEAGPPPARAASKKSDHMKAYLRRNGQEADDEELNHSLTWLLATLPEESSATEFGPRLLRLRDAAQGLWREELQLASDTSRVEDCLELAAAFARSGDLKPVRSESGIWPGNSRYGLTYSRDGLLLATFDHEEVQVWNFANRTRAARLPIAGIREVAFSTDGKSLFLAGGERGPSILRRVRWTDGHVEQQFETHDETITSLQLSADQGVLVTTSYENVHRVWDGGSGKVVRSYDVDRSTPEPLLRPDGKLLLRHDPADGWVAEALPPETAKKAKLPFRPACFAPDGSVLYALESALTLRARRPDGDFAPLGPELACESLRSPVVSPDGKLMAFSAEKLIGKGEFSSERWPVVHVYSLPELKLKFVTDVVSYDDDHRDTTCEFSPDGRTLAVAVPYEMPKFFDTATGKPLVLGEGHQSAIAHAAFSADGKTLRTFSHVDSICTWDAATMKLLKRTPAPAGRQFIAARTDGRFAVYALVTEPTGPVKVVDADSGAIMCEVALPPSFHYRHSRFIWIGDAEIFWCHQDDWARIDYRAGKITARGGVDISKQNSLFNGRGELTEDGKTLFHVGGDYRSGKLDVVSTDLTTMQTTELPEFAPERWPHGDFQLIPGGKWFMIGLQIYERDTRRRVAMKDLGRLDILSSAVSADGTRAAIVTGERIYIDNNFNAYDSGTKSIVRIHELPSMKTVQAFFPQTRWIRQLVFSPDASRIAVLDDDNTIEVRPLR